MTTNLKHTPGPWAVKGRDIFSEREEPLATLSYGIGVQEQQANAVLIAAAPELLEAAKELLSLDCNVNSYQRLKEAINKAEGKLV